MGELSGKPIVNPHFLIGSACIVGKDGDNQQEWHRAAMPRGRQRHAQQGNDGRIYIEPFKAILNGPAGFHFLPQEFCRLAPRHSGNLPDLTLPMRERHRA